MAALGLGPHLCHNRRKLSATPPSVPSFPAAPSLWGGWEADYTGNTFETVTRTFTTTAVDTTSNQIDIGINTFGAFTTPASAMGTPVFFSSTGTLPAPLVAGVPYYISLVSGTSYKIYPAATDADVATLTRATPDENVAPGQNYAQRENAIDLTTQGTGTHTLYTRELISVYKDRVNGYDVTPLSASDRQTWMETYVDGDGNKYILSDRIMRDPAGDNSYEFYGKTHNIGPSAKRLEIKQRSGQKRLVWQSYVAEFKPHKTRGYPKAPVDSTKVNTATNLITYTAHVLNTADRVRVVADSGATLPAPLAINTDYYIRDVSANTFSLHPTSADATANTNIIDLTTTGSGTFTFYAPARVGDANRWGFLTELIEPGTGNGNVLSPRSNYTAPSLGGKFSFNGTSIISTGSTNGCITNLKTLFDYGKNVMKVDVWIPSGSTAPTRQDTGLPLTSGTYWATRQPSSSTYGRLHDTQAHAIANVANLANAIPAGEVIKYTASGTGEWLCNLHEDEGTPYEFGYIVSGALGTVLIPFNEKLNITFVADYNDPDPSVLYVKLYMYINGVLANTITTATAKGDTGTAVLGSPGTFFNSAASHVPFIGKIYAAFFGSHATAFPTADLDDVHDYLLAKYHIA